MILMIIILNWPLISPLLIHAFTFYSFISVVERFGLILSPIKLKVRLPIVESERCLTAYRPHNLQLGTGQVCAGGTRGHDSCMGDSGGPLMFYNRKSAAWVVSGIVSLGLEQCGIPGVPGIYTKVENYNDWIVSKVRK